MNDRPVMRKPIPKACLRLGSLDVLVMCSAIGNAIHAVGRRMSLHVRQLLSLSLLSILAACGGGDDVAAEPERATSAASSDTKHALATAATLRSSTPGARELFGARPSQDSLDLNGDGKADLLWYKAGTGETVAWMMDGKNLIAGDGLLRHPAYRVIGSADLNGDGKSDLLWYNASTGETAAWQMDGISYTSGSVLLKDPNFRLIGAPDLDGDGKSELLWYNAVSGQTIAWVMNGTAGAGGALLLTDPNFKVIATPDLNGDGKTDLLWYNAVTGTTYAWLMNGLANIAGAELLTDPDFKVIGTPDLNGDGKSDLLWYSAQSGETYAWLMNGLGFVSGRSLLQHPDFKVIATPDLNGDQKSDLLWYNAATGMTYSWLMNGTSIISGSELLTDANFKVVATADMNGDGKADLLWHSAAAGQNYAWLMNGNAILDSGNVLTDPNYRLVTAYTAPVAHAGTDQIVTFGKTATLDGIASRGASGGPLAFSWVLTSRPVGSAAVLVGATSAAPTFVADLVGSYVASLVVNDGKSSSAAATVTVTAGRLAAAVYLSGYTAAQIEAAAQAAENDLPPPRIVYAVDNYRVSYRTIDGFGREVTASGLLSLPVKPAGTTSPILSYQHGTIFKNAEAPSVDDQPGTVPVMLASMGYIVVAADYVGYGDSQGEEHPYLLAEPTAAAVLDMLSAARTWLGQHGFADNGQLFLIGYSEGGYATMAAHRALQARESGDLAALVLNVPGGGPYNVGTTLDVLLDRVRDENPLLGALISPGFLRYLGSSLRNEVRRALLGQLIPDDADVTFQTAFIDNFLADDRAAIGRDSDVHDWRPQAPVWMFHGRDDQSVPYASAQSALNAMLARAAPQVSLVDCPAVPSSHLGCVPPYWLFMLDRLGALARNL